MLKVTGCIENTQCQPLDNEKITLTKAYVHNDKILITFFKTCIGLLM